MLLSVYSNVVDLEGFPFEVTICEDEHEHAPDARDKRELWQRLRDVAGAPGGERPWICVGRMLYRPVEVSD